jgi:thiazole synthase ThiGH ThiG subunit
MCRADRGTETRGVLLNAAVAAAGVDVAFAVAVAVAVTVHKPIYTLLLRCFFSFLT